MAKRDTAEYVTAAEEALVTAPLPDNPDDYLAAQSSEPEPFADEMLAAGPDGSAYAVAAANERAPLATADIKYILRLIGDFLPGAQAQTVRVFGQRCVALRGESGDILVVTSLSDMRTLLSAVQGAY